LTKDLELFGQASFARNKKAQEFENSRLPMLVFSPIIKV
jgi:hypothetical protein